MASPLTGLRRRTGGQGGYSLLRQHEIEAPEAPEGSSKHAIISLDTGGTDAPSAPHTPHSPSTATLSDCVASLCVPVAPSASSAEPTTLPVARSLHGTCAMTLYKSNGLFSLGQRITSIEELPNGRIATGSVFSSAVHVWDTRTGSFVHSLRGPSAVFCLVALPDGRLASGHRDKIVRVWDLCSGACALTLSGHAHVVTCLAILPDGHLASGSHDGTVRVWDVRSGSCILTLSGHSRAVHKLAVLPDGRLATVGLDKTVRVWDVRSGSCALTLSGHSSIVWSLAVLPDGRLASGSWDKTMRVWE